jgi:molybdenum cofactor cytidylyltransferase
MTAPASGPVVAVVLAAGEGRRFEGSEHKLRSVVAGRAVLTRSVDAAVSSGVGPVIVVSGAAEVADLVPPGVTVVDNPTWADGQASSLRVGIRYAEAVGASAVVVGLGDMPLVDPATWREVADRDAPIVTASYDGHRRPPVKLDRSVWADLPNTGDVGARALRDSRHHEVVDVEVARGGDDVDTVADLERCRSESAGTDGPGRDR